MRIAGKLSKYVEYFPEVANWAVYTLLTLNHGYWGILCGLLAFQYLVWVVCSTLAGKLRVSLLYNALCSSEQDYFPEHNCKFNTWSFFNTWLLHKPISANNKRIIYYSTNFKARQYFVSLILVVTVKI